MKTSKKRINKQKSIQWIDTSETDGNLPEPIPEETKNKFFINKPYYDFIYAEEELGLNFSELSENGFKEFLDIIYVNDLIELRKAYIKRDYAVIRFLSHKLKSPFTYMYTKKV